MYMTAPEGEKIWCRLGLLFEAKNAGIAAVIVRALYSLKSADADFLYRLTDCIAAFGLGIMRGRSGRVSKACLNLQP